MKQNPKEIVNIVMLVEEFIAKLNTECVKHKVQKYYKVSITDTEDKKGKRLQLTVADLDTNERIILFSLDYTFSNPAKALTDSYKRTLYREFLFNCVGLFSFNMEQNIKYNRTKSKLESQDTFNPHAEHPISLDETMPAPVIPTE